MFHKLQGQKKFYILSSTWKLTFDCVFFVFFFLFEHDERFQRKYKMEISYRGNVIVDFLLENYVHFFGRRIVVFGYGGVAKGYHGWQLKLSVFISYDWKVSNLNFAIKWTWFLF